MPDSHPLDLPVFTIADDIRDAHTLPARVYSDPDVLGLQTERIFARSWQLVGDTDQVKVPGRCGR